MGLRDFTVFSVIKRNSELHRDRVAMICGEETITYGQLHERTNRLAKGLLQRGLARGDRIAVLAENSAEFVYLYAAAAKTGAVVVPVNWRLNQYEIGFVISDVGPKLIFAGENFQDTAARFISSTGGAAGVFSMAASNGVFEAFYELMDNDGDCPETDVGSPDPYVILHTAAVDGKPRGAVISHEGLILSCLQTLACWNLTERDCNLAFLPLFHITGLVFWLTVMQAGGTNVILPRFDPDLALKQIQDYRVTVFAEFPPILATLLDRNRELSFDLSSLRIIGGIETPDTAKRCEQETGATFWAAYGQSETSGLVTYAPYFERLGSAGRPGLMTDVGIMDDLGNLLPPEATGEIVIRGPVVFRGYWNREEDAQHTLRYGWSHTGDMGRMDRDGYLYYAGRLPEKDLIKPGGENVYPAEVEKAILEHPLVEEACVIGVPDRQWGEAVKAICVIKEGESLDPTELIDFVAARIARYKKPKHVVFVGELPKTKDGLVDRTLVKTLHSGG